MYRNTTLIKTSNFVKFYPQLKVNQFEPRSSTNACNIPNHQYNAAMSHFSHLKINACKRFMLQIWCLWMCSANRSCRQSACKQCIDIQVATPSN